MAHCNLCLTDFSISSGGRTGGLTGVSRHQESARHAKLAKSMGSMKHSQSLYSSSNLTDFLKFVGILLATQVPISLAGFCVNFINICTGTNKMLGIVVYRFFLTYF